MQECLLQLAAEGNPKFTRALHPGIENILGLRVPDVRNLAARVAASPDWERLLAELEHIYMEERMLHGMVLGYVKSLPLEERLEHLRAFIPLITAGRSATLCARRRLSHVGILKKSGVFSRPILLLLTNMPCALPSL